ncbi:hypothetical protein J7E83_04305 [Arthrobacter sp. ISL-48]|uniref:hypothetical protein n=1 Tax=Arthrobacter sp. ISL-48 TaxID=2819110 RepID=UPI001BE80235|nr:hypothetical protein [Arthrobacter sp. ISL-48]MBT2531359.1 hypothetical protein [Arthrobacter sp. ISL-48]
MGIFKRKSSEAEAADSDLTFFTYSKANEFRAIAREVFAEMGLEVQVHPGHAVDDSGREFGFWNVGATCYQQPQSTWRGVIAEHLRRVLASFEAPDPFDVLASQDVPLRTFARLYDETSIPGINSYPHRELAPGIVEMLALDLPDTVAVFNHDNANKFGGWEALQRQGIENLRSLEIEQLETLPAPGGGTFNALLGESVYTASRALLLPDLATELTGQRVQKEFGWLMSIPNRHQVAWHIIESAAVVSALNGMARFTAMGYADAPGSVSPHVFWWNGTSYEQLTHVRDDGTLTLHVSPAFQAVLTSVTADG